MIKSLRSFKTIQDKIKRINKELWSEEFKDVSSYAKIGKDHKGGSIAQVNINKVCHAQMFQNHDFKRCDRILTRIKLHPDFPKESQIYFKWLINQSPLSYLYKNSYKNAMDNSLIVRTDVPDNLPTYAIIALRQGYEHERFKHDVKIWYDLKRAGVDPCIAFFCFGKIIPTNNGYKIRNDSELHAANSLISDESVKKFIKGEYMFKSPSTFKQTAQTKGGDIFKTFDNPSNPFSLKNYLSKEKKKGEYYRMWGVDSGVFKTKKDLIRAFKEYQDECIYS